MRPSRPIRPRTSFERQCCELVRSTLKAAAFTIAGICPVGRELNSSLKCLEEAQDWALNAITRVYPPKDIFHV